MSARRLLARQDLPIYFVGDIAHHQVVGGVLLDKTLYAHELHELF